MAEFVQQSVEKMLPELEQMARIGIFSQEETRSILKKRKNYEYKMRRRTKEKEDILQYVQYEINLLALIRKRRQKLGIHYKKLEIDVAIVFRVHSLFRMACHRFQNDTKLWLSHIEFAKTRGEKATVSRLMLRMLQVHSRKPELWIMAAKWEFESNKSTENARTLLQRALRFNPENKVLWLEYYRLELLNVDKLRKRREILGLQGKDGDEAEETMEQGSAVLEGKIADLVFMNAMEAFPDDVDFCLSFLTVCDLFDFTSKQVDEMLTSLKARFNDKEELWNVLGSREAGSALLEKDCGADAVFEQDLTKASVYKRGCMELNTEKMWQYHIMFWLDRIRTKTSRKLNEKRVSQCLSVLTRADDEGLLSAEMKFGWIDLLSKLGELDDAKHQSNLATESHVTNADLWLQRLTLLVHSNHQQDAIVDLFKTAVQNIVSDDVIALWVVIIEWCCVVQCCHLDALFQLGMKSPIPAVVLMCKSYQLKYVLLNEGIKSARKTFHKLLETKPISKDLIKEYVQMELTQEKPKLDRVRKAFDTAVDEFGKDNTDVWIDYINFELSQIQSNKDMTKTSELHWKAMKMLDGLLIQNFVHEYTLLIN